MVTKFILQSKLFIFKGIHDNLVMVDKIMMSGIIPMYIKCLA